MKHKTPSGFVSLQYRDELEPFVELLKAEGVRRYLEVGCCNGGTFHRIMTSLPEPCAGVAVDLPSAGWGERNSRKRLRAVIRDLRCRHITANVVFGDSKSVEVHKAVDALGPFDAVFIDGDHTYEGVSSDWSIYGRMARIVAFHDIACNDGIIEVPRLWAELKATHRHVEIVRGVPALGIGVLWRE